ncbi:MAG TPA: aspartate aminotransferase family protein [bacterium]|nr:aspartate aminotransferase family protein [bacterium]
MATVYGRQVVEQYLDHNRRSEELNKRARAVLPGGVTRTSVYFDPFPPYIERGEGCRITDVDGNVRIDFSNNYTALILGHCPPPVTAAVQAQAARGSAFAAPGRPEVTLAELITRRVPSVAQIRFASSGTEAVMFALRLARAFTGRSKIAKAEGGFHGTSEYASISVSPDVAEAGPGPAPAALAASRGITRRVLDEVVVFPFNDAEATEAIIRRHRDDLAAVIVEPMLGSSGMIPARREFLQRLRDLTARSGILLILDEIITLRLAPGGAQSLYGVSPDLTVMGKIIGGGYPVAAFGGRGDIMALLDPEGGRPPVPQSGTYNGNPIGMVAGSVTLGELTPAVYDRLNAMGEDLRARLGSLFRRKGVAAQATGMGSLLNLHFTEREVTDFRTMRTGDAARMRQVFFGLLNEGIFLAPRGMACLSTPMGESEIDAFVRATERALEG